MYKTPVNAPVQRAAGGNNNPRPPVPATIPEASALAFAQRAAAATRPTSAIIAGPPVPGTDGRTLHDIDCFGCRRYGHHAGECPTAAASGVTLVQFAYMLAQAGGDPGIDPD